MSQAKDGPSDRELSRITGLDAKTIRLGRREVANETVAQMGSRQRRSGGDASVLKKRWQISSSAARSHRTAYRGGPDDEQEMAELSVARHSGEIRGARP